MATNHFSNDLHLQMNKRSYQHQRERRSNPPAKEASFFFDFKGDVELVDSVTNQSEEMKKTFVSWHHRVQVRFFEASYFNMTVEWPGKGEVKLQRLYNDITSRTKDHSAYAAIQHMKFLLGQKDVLDIIKEVDCLRFYFDCAPDVRLPPPLSE